MATTVKTVLPIRGIQLTPFVSVLWDTSKEPPTFQGSDATVEITLDADNRAWVFDLPASLSLRVGFNLITNSLRAFARSLRDQFAHGLLNVGPLADIEPLGPTTPTTESTSN